MSLSHPNASGEDRGRVYLPYVDPNVEIRRSIKTLFDKNTVLELRAFRKGSIASGYYDDHKTLAVHAMIFDQNHYQVYVTLNPVDPSLLARAANSTVAGPKSTTADKDVVGRRWIFLNLDPVRPAGTSSTAEEKAAAKARAQDIGKYLREQGWPDPVAAASGNGALRTTVDPATPREEPELNARKTSPGSA